MALRAVESAEESEVRRISEALLADFPNAVIENKDGQRFIGHEHIRMRIIEATNNRFDWRIDLVEYRNDGALRERQDKRTGELHTPMVCVVTGTLIIPGLGSRSDTGVQEIQHGSGADSAYKGAVSDCLKRCAMNFGVGLRQLYMGEVVNDSQNAPRTQNKAPTSDDAPVSPIIGRMDVFDERLAEATATTNGQERKGLFNLLWKEAIGERDADKARKLIEAVESFAQAKTLLDLAADKHDLNTREMIAALNNRPDNPNRPIVDKDTILPGTMTDLQRRTMFAIQKEIGMNEDDVKAYIKEQFDLDSRTQLSGHQAEKVITWLRSLKG